MPDEVDGRLTLGCIVVGAVLLGFAAMLYGGASLNKTSTGVVEPLVACLGAAVLALGIVLRWRWVRHGNRPRPPT